VERVVILGRGGSGKSTAARQLGAKTGLPVIELDLKFWRSDLSPTPAAEWRRFQEEFAASDRWIADGDLGPYDSVDVRLAAADTVVVLDFSLMRCTLRSLRRSRERLDFWLWVWTWRRRSRPHLVSSIQHFAPNAEVHILRNPSELDRFLLPSDLPKSACLVV
jgi:adenylate kinase family enzyme